MMETTNNSPVLEAVNSMIDLIARIPHDWGDRQMALEGKLFQHIAKWNDQVSREKDGTGYAFAKPACFLEIPPIKWKQLNAGVNCCDLKIKFHIVDQQLDAGDGTMDQNLQVINYRDLFMNAFIGYKLPYGGNFKTTDEQEDTKHKSVYHHQVTMVTFFRDTKGAAVDPDSGKYVTIEPDTATLDLTTEKMNTTNGA